MKIEINSLKAVFFTKDWYGNKDHRDNYSNEILGAGQKIRVEFFDAEVVIGFSSCYSPNRQGFFLIPADNNGNNERIFVVKSSTKEVECI